MAVFWDATPCKLVQTDCRFRENIPENSHLITRR